MSFVDTVKERLEQARESRPLLDHVIRAVQHYGAAHGNAHAGAVTFFGFLSFFPIMALAFFVVGYVSSVYPDAQDQLIEAIDQVLPGMVSADGADNTIAISDVEDAAGAAAGIGLAGVLYSGLGWLSAMREALMGVFEMPAREKPNFVVGKGKDLVTLVLVGVVLIVSVAVAGAVTGFSDAILEWLRIDNELDWLLGLLGVAIGLAANTLLFFALFKLLADPPTPRISLFKGALLGALGFEALKQLSTYLISSTKDQPAFQAFGIALILLVWINYFSRVVMLAAAWAHVAPAARAQREREQASDGRVEGPRLDLEAAAAAQPGPARGSRAAFAAGAAAMLGLVAAVRRLTAR